MSFFALLGFFLPAGGKMHACSSPEEVKAAFSHAVASTTQSHQTLLFVQGVVGSATLCLNLREAL